MLLRNKGFVSMITTSTSFLAVSLTTVLLIATPPTTISTTTFTTLSTTLFYQRQHYSEQHHVSSVVHPPVSILNTISNPPGNCVSNPPHNTINQTINSAINNTRNASPNNILLVIGTAGKRLEQYTGIMPAVRFIFPIKRRRSLFFFRSFKHIKRPQAYCSQSKWRQSATPPWPHKVNGMLCTRDARPVRHSPVQKLIQHSVRALLRNCNLLY